MTCSKTKYNDDAFKNKMAMTYLKIKHWDDVFKNKI